MVTAIAKSWNIVLLLSSVFSMGAACTKGRSCPDVRIVVDDAVIATNAVVTLVPDRVTATSTCWCFDKFFDDLIVIVETRVNSNVPRVSSSDMKTAGAYPPFDSANVGQAWIRYCYYHNSTTRAPDVDTRIDYGYKYIFYWKKAEIYTEVHNFTTFTPARKTTPQV